MATLIAISMFLANTLPASAIANEATPTPTPDTPPASLCLTAAPTFERLNAVIQTAIADGTPVTQRTPGTVSDGTPADAATSAAIIATIRELVGCYNAGEPLRAFGLYTDDYLGQLFIRQGPFTRAAYDGYATPEPIADPSKHTIILEIRDIRTFADGSAGATVTLHYASIPVPKTFFFSFTWNGDRWMISGILGEISFSVP